MKKQTHTCNMCQEKLKELDDSVGVCINAECPNYALLQICEEDMYKLSMPIKRVSKKE